jgi:formylglycine-generating enzyme required for sulfatase activity
LHFEVFLKHEGGLKWDPIGKTPSGSPLKIPRCASWTVRPSDLGLVDMNTVAREIAAKKIPGLWLSFVATDADLAHLKGLTELQLFGLWDANITDAGLAHLKGMTGLEDLNVSGTKITNAGLAHLKGLTKLRNLDLGRTRVSDAGLAHLKGLTGLQELGLWGTKTTDAGVAHLRGLTGLQELGLSGTNITDAGLAHLKGLEGLRMLSLSGANITDAGLAHLKSLKGLQVLHLQQTKVTDAGLANLKGLAGLQWLSLRDTKVTDAGLAEMRKAFPKARIYPKEAATRKYITLDLGKSVTMKLVLIPAGKFLMGSRLSPTVTAQRYKARQSRCADEHPQHEVIISKPFYMGIHEVTQAQWRLVMGTEPWDGEAYSRSSNPANCIEWNDASKFCEKLSKKTGKKVALPTEAQWEYACRARSKTVYCFGDYPKRLGDYAWYLYNSMSGKDKQRRYLNPVGRKKPNAWGLHDMHGSVNEWCSDYYSEDYYGFAKELKSQRVDPRGFSVGTRHVLRGGSWASPPDECRSAARDAFSQVGIVGVGFRVVVSAGGVD